MWLIAVQRQSREKVDACGALVDHPAGRHAFDSTSDPDGALALLARHRAEFPAGALGHEADLARVDALLALGRRDDAESLLSQLSLGEGGRASELRVMRAELTARHDCRSALVDFSAVLATSDAARPSVERAWRGCAACRGLLGDHEGMRADLHAYLNLFPGGRFADEARRRLDGN